MSQYRNIFLVYFFLFSGIVLSQDILKTNIEATQSQINNSITTAQEYLEKNDFLKAQMELNNALKSAKSIDDKKSIGQIQSKIGKLQFLLNEPNNAKTTLIKAVEIQRLFKDNINIADTYITLGDVYMALGNQKQAVDYYKSAETIFQEENLINFESAAILKTGIAYLALNDYKKAEFELNRAVLHAEKYNLDSILSHSLIHLGKVQWQLNAKNKAIKSVNKGYAIAKDNNLINILNTGNLVLSDFHEKNGNLGLSFKYLKQYIKISDSLIANKKEQFSTEKAVNSYISTVEEYQKEAETSLEEKAEANSFNQLTTILSIALITILSLLTLSLYKNNNIRLKSNNVLHKKNEELIVAMEKAELASRTKANFLSTVTHELRTPLYAVTGLTTMLLDENPKPDQIQHLKSLKFSGDYLLTFINDILQINKIEANKVDVEPEIFNLKKKISNVISALNNSALDNNVKLHLEYDAHLPQNFNADQLKISQILINLIGNSIKFTKDGDIWVRAHKISEDNGIYNIRFEIEDNGIGISEEKQKNMFESFSQGSIQINRKYGGTGLGLSIVKGLIDILKGKIYLKSKLGQGTSFFFEIPLVYSEQIEKEEPTNYFKDINEIDLESMKILVVEDNKINQMITKKILNKMNLNCEVVDNGEAAVKKVKEINYDVVLMDIHMPGISGIEATKIIRSFDKDLTIFALTAVTIEDKMQEFEDAGFTDIISKPFKQEDFEKKLFEALV